MCSLSSESTTNILETTPRSRPLQEMHQFYLRKFCFISFCFGSGYSASKYILAHLRTHQSSTYKGRRIHCSCPLSLLNQCILGKFSILHATTTVMTRGKNISSVKYVKHFPQSSEITEISVVFFYVGQDKDSISFHFTD